MSPACPNQFPSLDAPYRLALVGEAPGETEVALSKPFCGHAGGLLDRTLGSVALDRRCCFVGNVCQERPGRASNDFSRLDWRGEAVQSGIAQLILDLEQFQPCLVVALGNVPLHLLKHGNIPPDRLKNGQIRWTSSITRWRGSLFPSSPRLTPHCWHGEDPEAEAAITLPGEPPATPRDPPWKCLATWHPAFILRVYSKLFDLRQDLMKAREEARNPGLTLPRLEFAWGPAPEAKPDFMSTFREPQP